MNTPRRHINPTVSRDHFSRSTHAARDTTEDPQSMTATPTENAVPPHNPRPLVDLLVSIVAPSVILVKFSGDEHLGAAAALVVALAFPISWGAFELVRY